MARMMSKREIRARIVDAIGGGLCPKHGEYLGIGKYGLRACPYCDIEEHHEQEKIDEPTKKD
jgi:hypothetical protein